MKLCYSTQNIENFSFLDCCKLAYSYSLDGFEICDAFYERKCHKDSILRTENTVDSRRKLRNRNLSIPILSCPKALDENFKEEELLQYVDMAAACGIPAIGLFIEKDIKNLKQLLLPATKKAKQQDIEILFETKGYLCHSEKAIELLKELASPVFGITWNIRESYFNAKENPEIGIKNLGAYIRYVRIGDQKEGVKVLLGDGTLPVKDYLNALSSLNYEGFICIDKNDEISDPDILLTHFRYYLAGLSSFEEQKRTLYYNRSHTGSFPWKKYEILNTTFPEVLEKLAEYYPDRPVFKYPSQGFRRTYLEFSKEVDEIAASFIALGVKPGYHIAIWAGNVPEWFLSFWAAVKIGAVLVTVNTAYKTNEIEYLLRQSDTHTLIMTSGYKDVDYIKIMQELLPELKGHKKGEAFYAKTLPFLRHVITVGCSMEGCMDWEEMLEKGKNIPLEEVKRRAKAVKPDDVANMQYTSGTTGFPKGVMLTHRNIINNGKTIGDRMDLSSIDKMLVQVPMFHCFGMVLTMTSIMTHAGCLYPLPYFSPRSSLSVINSEKITCMNGVPTMFTAMFSHKDFAKTDFSHMRTGIMAGSNCPPELMKRAAEEMNMKEILSVYGQTEASPGCTMGEVNEDLAHRTETVGSAFPNVECKIIDPATGEDLPDEKEGEFVARGFNIMKGYYKMPEETAKTIDKDGWLHTGDICLRTKDGYYKVTGRLKDMIIRGGENIYPREIEEFYLTHPKIKDVQVIGVPDKVYGEEICAWIILKENEKLEEKDLKNYALERIAKHKVPRYFVFTENFPMNAAGKVLKYKMKEIFMEGK